MGIKKDLLALKERAQNALNHNNSNLVKKGVDEASDLHDVGNHISEIVSTVREKQEKTLTVTENGDYEVTPDEDKELSKVTAKVAIPPKPEQEKFVRIEENGTVIVEPDTGHSISKATVEVAIPIKEEQKKDLKITKNGPYNLLPDENHLFSEVNVEVDVGGLPDWDDDSPIIASGNGYVGRNTWELTEKGTLRWVLTSDYKGVHFVNSTSLNMITMNRELVSILPKVKQVYIPDGVTEAELLYMYNCVRVRLPDSLSYRLNLALMTALKELNLDYECYDVMPSYHCSNMYSLESITFPSTLTVLPSNCFAGCWSLKDINLENIIKFENACFDTTLDLKKPIVFNKELVSIGTNAFRYSSITSITFQEPTNSVYPTIQVNSFSSCRGLEHVDIPNGWNTSLYFPDSPLTQMCLHAMIEAFADMTDALTPPTFQVENANLAKIDAYHKTMLDDKGWLYK